MSTSVVLEGEPRAALTRGPIGVDAGADLFLLGAAI